jgi:hypothetical protein
MYVKPKEKKAGTAAPELSGRSSSSLDNKQGDGRGSMLARLGNVLYWTGCLLGILLVAAAVALYSPDYMDRVHSAIYIGLAVVVWLIGRACRYVLAGR